MSHTFRFESALPVDRETAFAWHERPGGFDRLSPPWKPAKLLSWDGIRDGDEAKIELRLGPLKKIWHAVHQNYREGEQFEDIQRSGPFAAWHHRHLFEPGADGNARMVDQGSYRLPLEPLSRWVAGGFAKREIEQLFCYRHQTLIDDLSRHQAFSRPQKVLVSGASGLVGTALCATLTSGGHRVVRLVRREPQNVDELRWDTERGVYDPTPLEGFDAVIHLAGAGIADKRWSPERKKVLVDSRVQGTRALVDSLATLQQPPKTFIGASAIGYYGDTDDRPRTENDAPGGGFLPELSQQWEEASRSAERFGARVVLLRIGIVLSPLGGMLGKLYPIFKLGGGGPVSDGKQWISWVSLDDVVWSALTALQQESMLGPYNLVSPNSVRQGEFARTLGKVLRRPAFFPVPAAMLRLAFGEMADATVLASTHASAKGLQDAGYRHRDLELEPTLRRLLGKMEITS